MCAFALKGVSLFPLFVSLQNYLRRRRRRTTTLFFLTARKKERKKMKEKKMCKNSSHKQKLSSSLFRPSRFNTTINYTQNCFYDRPTREETTTTTTTATTPRRKKKDVFYRHRGVPRDEFSRVLVVVAVFGGGEAHLCGGKTIGFCGASSSSSSSFSSLTSS